MTLLQVQEIVSPGWLERVKNIAWEYGPNIVAAILIYIVGMWVINMVVSGVKKVLNKKSYDASLQSFLVSLIKVALLVLLFIVILGKLGVGTTSFAALLAGAGLAIGAALNGSLGNLAGGVMLMIFKPFKVGDFIEAQTITGQVKEMGIFNTTVLTPENKTVFIPNGPLSTGVITNFTVAGYLRVDLTMAIAPDQPVEKAKEVAIAAMKQHPKVLATPAPEANVLKIGDGMITLAIRPYTAQPDYWDVYFGVQELVYKAWGAAGIAGPTPTRIIINK